MSATTIGAVTDRVAAILTANSFQSSGSHFDFDDQSNLSLDKSFRVNSSRTATEGYVGAVQLETHTIEIWLARKIKRDSNGAARQLKVDMDLIEQTMLDDSATHHYYVVDNGVEHEIREPAATDQGFVIGRLSARVEIERTT